MCQVDLTAAKKLESRPIKADRSNQRSLQVVGLDTTCRSKSRHEDRDISPRSNSFCGSATGFWLSSTWIPDAATVALSTAIIDIAQARRRFGYRRIHDLLRPEFPNVNHKRMYRLYSVAKLAVQKPKKAKRPVSERMPLQIAQDVNEVWSMDFVSDSLANGRLIKCLTVADDFSHECVDIAADFGISGQYVTRLLDQAATFRGYPSAVRTDNGPEFTSRAFMAWAQTHGIRHLLIQPGRPMQNGYIESFNAKFRDECLNEHWFDRGRQS